MLTPTPPTEEEIAAWTQSHCLINQFDGRGVLECRLLAQKQALTPDLDALIAEVDTAVQGMKLRCPLQVFARLSTKLVEIQDADGTPVIPWPGFDDNAIPLNQRYAIAMGIVTLVNAWPRLRVALGGVK